MPTYRSLPRRAQSIIRRLPVQPHDQPEPADFDLDEYTPGGYHTRRGDWDDIHGTDGMERVRLNEADRTLIGGTIGEGILVGAAAIRRGEEAEIWPEDEEILKSWVLLRHHCPSLLENPELEPES